MAENTRLPEDQQGNRKDGMDFSFYSHIPSAVADDAAAEDTAAAPDTREYDAAANNVAANEQATIGQEGHSSAVDVNAMTPASTHQSFSTGQAGTAQNTIPVPVHHPIPAPVSDIPATVDYWQRQFENLTHHSRHATPFNHMQAGNMSVPPVPAPPVPAPPVPAHPMPAPSQVTRLTDVLPHFDEATQAHINALVARLPPPPPPASNARRPWTQAEDDLLMFLWEVCRLSHRVISEHFLGRIGRSFAACETRASHNRKRRREG